MASGKIGDIRISFLAQSSFSAKVKKKSDVENFNRYIYDNAYDTRYGQRKEIEATRGVCVCVCVFLFLAISLNLFLRDCPRSYKFVGLEGHCIPLCSEITNNPSSESHLTPLTQGHLAKSCPFLEMGVRGLIRKTIHSTGHSNVRELFSSLLDISERKSHTHFPINLSKFILFPAEKLFSKFCPHHS